ncbi:hypothetical protein Goari_002198 [Gossypium aridum]|uniref:Uncharacterized protein n=1 Tax=Gossypium aridum TaxID=34290 RepID=A0A7J8Y828_GOSAI|nr:hypothetical protein [Gossypium aridum]
MSVSITNIFQLKPKLFLKA